MSLAATEEARIVHKLPGRVRGTCPFVSAQDAEEFAVANDPTFDICKISEAQHQISIHDRCAVAPGHGRRTQMGYQICCAFRRHESILITARLSKPRNPAA